MLSLPLYDHIPAAFHEEGCLVCCLGGRTEEYIGSWFEENPGWRSKAMSIFLIGGIWMVIALTSHFKY